MKKIYKGLSLAILPVALAGCTNQITDNEELQWDFDHSVQYRQTKLSENSYNLVIVPKVKTHFNRLATFLLRHSKDICGDYGYKIEVLDGVQGFHDIEGSPNLILSSLSANIECVAK